VNANCPTHSSEEMVGNRYRWVGLPTECGDRNPLPSSALATPSLGFVATALVSSEKDRGGSVRKSWNHVRISSASNSALPLRRNATRQAFLPLCSLFNPPIRKPRKLIPHRNQKPKVQEFVMLNTHKAFSSFSVNDIQKAKELWHDPRARTFQRSRRYVGCTAFRQHQSSDVPKS
jgi:hypothetical protein